jgi:ubiquinone biosynthesis monooxygenase Coq7
MTKDTTSGPTAAQRRAHRLPGDPRPADTVAAMIRVDQAGEYGAKRIYEGQLAILGRSRAAAPIRAMAAQEKRHLAEFDRLLVARRVRPTALAPLWHVAGFALGAATALLGTRAAMACTVAVEEVIDAHYSDQAEQLGDSEKALKATIAEFRDDELEHRTVALEHGARETLGYEVLTTVIKAGSRLAIFLSSRI